MLLGFVTGAGELLKLKGNVVLASDALLGGAQPVILPNLYHYVYEHYSLGPQVKCLEKPLSQSPYLLFLACNLSCLVTEVMYATLHYRQGNINLMVGIRCYRWYGHLLSHVFLPVLNGVLNPCLYLGRMTNFRVWIKRSVKNIVKNSQIRHSRSSNSILSPKVMNEIPNTQYIYYLADSDTV